MADLQEQLAALRRKIERIDRKYAAGPPAQRLPVDRRPARYFVEQWLSGEVVETPFGSHFETERLYERHRRHGSMEISNLLELPDDLLGPLSGGEAAPAPVSRWAFLDTETTGLAGGSGTYAFLIGVGSICEEGFRVRQFFMRDYGEEPSLLHALAEYLRRFDVLITFNGKTYDQPLLETRYRMARARPPFDRLAHLDLLHGARRLWKLRLESCRLVDLENQILGVEREGDLPGEMIPYVYFEYLRTQQAFRLVPIFHHNALDILTTACLTGIVPFAFREPHAAPLAHGTDLVGLARWCLKAGKREQALELMHRAVDLGLPEDLLFRTLWDTAALEKRSGNEPAALAIWTDLAASRNPYRVQALEALAKYYEHRERNYAMALEMIRCARTLADSEDLARRQERLERRLARRPGRLLCELGEA
ncbi:MAG TPA: ribonuclease H-like domain-containing protein [Bryobacteraceae bacterium]|nr:ribonuclease H-like domain-containing protein [Bryobacteraceae bacterium]HOQ46877.1 ribonuclease H-like domain-containing protein [Bryobacteraceae bacterium]HPU73002.1 ribonuclease H-like domain-containing protein [Bryobacteraceae bacterium]